METIQFSPSPAGRARAVGYLHDENPGMPQRKMRPCVVICPGGGYDHISMRESDPVALAFFARGYQVVILSYSLCEKAGDMRPLMELSQTMIHIREHCGEWNIISDQIAVCGFSAGGHLAASLGTLWDHSLLKEKMDTKGGRNRPDAMILGYPLITTGGFTHSGCKNWVTGGDPEAYKKLFSLEKQVTAAAPPAFLWHTVQDASVPVENTLLFAAALQRSHVPFECHIYPDGGHGQAMCNEECGTPNPHCATWFPLCTQWLENLFGFQY